MKKYNATAYERRVAKELRKDGLKYLARNKNGTLSAFENKPVKCYDNTWRDFPEPAVGLDDYHFSFVKWEDDEPTRIADILNGGRI